MLQDYSPHAKALGNNYIGVFLRPLNNTRFKGNRVSDTLYHVLPRNASQLDDIMCKHLMISRTGTLCGRCLPDHYIPWLTSSMQLVSLAHMPSGTGSGTSYPLLLIIISYLLHDCLAHEKL